ncbi:MAG: hypothetical protein ACLPT4_05540, partial [Verrucomicrobiia bacterium]
GGGGHGGFGGGHGGFGGGFHGGGYYGGYHGGYGHYGYGGWGWGGYPWFAYDYGWPYYAYYYPYDYYDYPPPVYDSPQTVYSAPPAAAVPDVNPPPSAIVADRDSSSPAPGATPHNYATQTLRTLSLGDVKALAKAGLSDEVILSQIRNSQAVYHLTTAEIIDLKHGGVSEKVIDYMINTANPHR